MEKNALDEVPSLIKIPSRISTIDERNTRAIEILKLPSKTRTVFQIETLKAALQIKYFVDLRAEHGDEVFNQILLKLKHEFHTDGSTVFNHGEKGRYFYVILRGAVGIFANVPKKILTPTELSSDKQLFELAEVNVLRPGSYFGELALLNDTTRTATIICKEDTDFAVLDGEDFKHILAAGGAWRVQKDIEFLNKTQFFSKVQKRQISTLIYQMKMSVIRRNSIIFKEGEESNYIYIIKKGEIKLLKDVEFKIKPTTLSILEDNQKQKLTYKKTVEIAILLEGQSFGEEDIYLNTKRQVSAVCISDTAELLVINAEDFQRRIRHISQFAPFFKEYCENKIISRAKRMQYITNIHDQNKDILYGIGGAAGVSQAKFQASPLKYRRYVSSSPSRRASQLLNFKEPMSANKPPSSQLDPSKGNNQSETLQKLPISKIDCGSNSPSFHPKTLNLIKLQETLTPISVRGEQSDSFSQNVSKGIATPGDTTPQKSLDAKLIPKNSKFKKSTSQEETISPRSPVTKLDAILSQVLKTDIVSSRVFANDKSPSNIQKTENLTFVGRSVSPADVAAIDPSASLPSFRRKHLSNKPHQVLKVEQMYAKESGKLSSDDPYKGLDVLKSQKRPRRKPTTEEIDPPSKLNLSPREMTISERIQPHKRSQSVMRPPSRTVNIHMEQLRNSKNTARILRTKSKTPNDNAVENQGF